LLRFAYATIVEGMVIDLSESHLQAEFALIKVFGVFVNIDLERLGSVIVARLLSATGTPEGENPVTITCVRSVENPCQIRMALG
jgi:hypothetical protein